jgi:hypothetical protein
MPNRLVCYSVCGDGPHLAQLLRSVESLRRHNTAIPVWVFVYGDLPPAVLNPLQAHDVRVRRLEGYAATLGKLSPHAAALSSYPVLPKYLSLVEMAELELSQLLCLDCDTFWFGDVAKLFERYDEHDVYGREEPCSPFSAYADSAYIDPTALSALFNSQGLRELPTINTGSFLLNHGLHRKLAPLVAALLDYVSRLMMGMCERQSPGDPLPYVTPTYDFQSSDERANGLPLPFPSSNAWIVDLVAFWLALGRLSEVSCGIFEVQDFLQGKEFLATSRQATAVACHYFSVNEVLFTAWLHGDVSGS